MPTPWEETRLFHRFLQLDGLLSISTTCERSSAKNVYAVKTSNRALILSRAGTGWQMSSTIERFFRAEPFASITTTLPAVLFNRLRLLQSRCSGDPLFVPVRAMQYLAVADGDEVIFVDSQAYTVSGGEGGRLIMLSWVFVQGASRDSLDQPVPVRVLYHQPQGEAAQKRMVVEFGKALTALQGGIGRDECGGRQKRVIPFRGNRE